MHLWKLCTVCSWRNCISKFIINYLDQAYLKCQSAVLILGFACFNNKYWIPSLVIHCIFFLFFFFFLVRCWIVVWRSCLYSDCLQWACVIRSQTWSRGWQHQHIWSCSWFPYCNTCTMTHPQLPWSGSCVLNCWQVTLLKSLFWSPSTLWHIWLLLHWLTFQVRLDTWLYVINNSVQLQVCSWVMS